MVAKKSNQLAKNSGLSGLGKDYIKALIDERLEVHDRGVDAKGQKVEMKNDKTSSSCGCNCKTNVDDLKSEIDILKSRYKEDDKFTLTRAKLIQFMETNRLE